MTLRTLNYGNYGIFLIMGNAGFCPSTVLLAMNLQAAKLATWLQGWGRASFGVEGFGFGGRGLGGNFGLKALQPKLKFSQEKEQKIKLRRIRRGALLPGALHHHAADHGPGSLRWLDPGGV